VTEALSYSTAQRRLPAGERQIALQEMVEAIRISKERVQPLEVVIKVFVPTWSMAPLRGALQARHGVDIIGANLRRRDRRPQPIIALHRLSACASSMLGDHAFVGLERFRLNLDHTLRL
jgi:hypothetical protein